MTTHQRQFEEQGYAIIQGILAPSVLKAVRRELDHLVGLTAEKLIAEGRITQRFEAEPFETRFYRLYEGHMDDAPTQFRPELHLRGMFDLFFNPQALDLVEQILGPEIRLYPNYTVRPKFPEWKGTEVLWHQDGGYTAPGAPGVSDLRMVNAWAPLVPAREANGCMQFVPGTHRLGVVPHETRPYYLEVSAEYLSRYAQNPVSIELDPGDLVLFHNLLFHRGLPNHSGAIRWSCDWRYQDANQPTMRKERGHLARSRNHPDQAVQDAADWAGRRFE